MGSGSGSQGSGSGSGSAVAADKPIPHIQYGPNAEQLALGTKLKQQLADEAKERARRVRQVKEDADNRKKEALAARKERLEAEKLNPPGSAELGKRIADVARGLEGREEWQHWRPKAPFGVMNSNKCNIFVYDVVTQLGATVPLFERENAVGEDLKYPPVTEQWANPDVKIGNWQVVLDPRPGDVAVTPAPPGEDQGHMGIVLENNKTVYQSSTHDKVVIGTWGFEPGQQARVVYRRYVPPTE